VRARVRARARVHVCACIGAAACCRSQRVQRARPSLPPSLPAPPPQPPACFHPACLWSMCSRADSGTESPGVGLEAPGNGEQGVGRHLWRHARIAPHRERARTCPRAAGAHRHAAWASFSAHGTTAPGRPAPQPPGTLFSAQATRAHCCCPRRRDTPRSRVLARAHIPPARRRNTMPCAWGCEAGVFFPSSCSCAGFEPFLPIPLPRAHHTGPPGGGGGVGAGARVRRRLGRGWARRGRTEDRGGGPQRRRGKRG